LVEFCKDENLFTLVNWMAIRSELCDFYFVITSETHTPISFGCRFYVYSLQSEKNPKYYGLVGVWDYMKEMTIDLKRAVLSMIHAFEIITSGFLSFQRNVLFCNGPASGFRIFE